MEATTALPTPAPAQNPTALTAAHTPPAVPAHIVQAAQSVEIAVAALPTSEVTSPKTASPAAPATLPTVTDPAHDLTKHPAVDLDAPPPVQQDTEVEAMLSGEIKKLWLLQKDGKASVRRTRAEMKALRLELAEKLYIMKLILVHAGRGGGCASYLRAQKLPLTSADRLVAQHEATFAPPAEKLPTGEVSTSTVDEVRQLARKTLLKVSRFLTTQELTYEFVHELIWGIDVAEMSYTDAGFEIPKIGSDDSPEVDAQVVEVAISTPAAA